MHYMSRSATTRSGRRQETSYRISQCAQRLTEDRGLDGFTMDELAEAAGVSRRTLFNYFPGKVDAVLGEAPHISEEALAEFRARDPFIAHDHFPACGTHRGHGAHSRQKLQPAPSLS